MAMSVATADHVQKQVYAVFALTTASWKLGVVHQGRRTVVKEGCKHAAVSHTVLAIRSIMCWPVYLWHFIQACAGDCMDDSLMCCVQRWLMPGDYYLAQLLYVYRGLQRSLPTYNLHACAYRPQQHDVELTRAAPRTPTCVPRLEEVESHRRDNHSCQSACPRQRSDHLARSGHPWVQCCATT